MSSSEHSYSVKGRMTVKYGSRTGCPVPSRSSRSRRCSSRGPRGPLSVPLDTDWPRQRSLSFQRGDGAQGGRYVEDGLDDLVDSPSPKMMTAAESWVPEPQV